MRTIPVILLVLLLIGAAIGMWRHGRVRPPVPAHGAKDRIVARFDGQTPHQWAEIVPGVKTRLETTDRVIALTLDACGSKNDGYDADLIDFLVREKVPATLFINARWIDKNPETFGRLAANPLFEIANHGMEHKPCSVNGRSAYGIPGTGSPAEVVNEIADNAEKIRLLTGKRPVYYRSGTAFYDDVAAQIAAALGETVAGFSVLGDAGATWPKEKIRSALTAATPGSIVICHMNHPEKETAEGIMAAVPVLKKRGFTFVKLSQYPLK